jgi:hypothetical protein
MLLKVLAAVRNAGPSGLIRDELASAFEIPVQSVCPVARALLNDGELVETKLRRPTRWGRLAAVLVHRDHREAVTS